MYNGIGLLTPRGSGTSGHVVTNSFNVRHRYQNFDKRDELHRQPALKKPDERILEHERKREIELKLAELEDELEVKGYSLSEIQEEVQKLRQRLEAEQDGLSARQHLEKLRARDDTHALAKRKEAELTKVASAFGIKRKSKPEEGEDGDHADRKRLAVDRREAEIAALEERLRKEEEEELTRARVKMERRKEEKRKRKEEKTAKKEAALRAAAEAERAAVDAERAAAEAAQREREVAELEDARRAVRRAQGYFAAEDEPPPRFGDVEQGSRGGSQGRERDDDAGVRTTGRGGSAQQGHRDGGRGSERRDDRYRSRRGSPKHRGRGERDYEGHQRSSSHRESWQNMGGQASIDSHHIMEQRIRRGSNDQQGERDLRREERNVDPRVGGERRHRESRPYRDTGALQRDGHHGAVRGSGREGDRGFRSDNTKQRTANAADDAAPRRERDGSMKGPHKGAPGNRCTRASPEAAAHLARASPVSGWPSEQCGRNRSQSSSGGGSGSTSTSGSGSTLSFGSDS